MYGCTPIEIVMRVACNLNLLGIVCSKGCIENHNVGPNVFPPWTTLLVPLLEAAMKKFELVLGCGFYFWRSVDNTGGKHCRRNLCS